MINTLIAISAEITLMMKRIEPLSIKNSGVRIPNSVWEFWTIGG